jgi:hypothetical protein
MNAMSYISSGTAYLADNCPTPDILQNWRTGTSSGTILGERLVSSPGYMYAIFQNPDEYRADAPARLDAAKDDLTSSGGAPLTVRKAETSRLLDQVKSFQRLPNDWAGEGTVLVDSGVYDVSERVLQALPTEIPLPQVTPSPDGEVGLSWIRNGGRFEVLVQPDQHLLWVIGRDGAYTPGGMINFAEHKSLLRLNMALRQFWYD